MTAGIVQMRFRNFSGLNKEDDHEHDANDADDSAI